VLFRGRSAAALEKSNIPQVLEVDGNQEGGKRKKRLHVLLKKQNKGSSA
jgi:hypothetical protein